MPWMLAREAVATPKTGLAVDRLALPAFTWAAYLGSINRSAEVVGMRQRKRVAIVMAEILLMLLTAAGCPVRTIVADVVEPLQDAVTDIIDEAAIQGNSLLITAAGQVALALGNFESAFAADLHRAVDDVDDALRERLNQLTDMVAELQNGAEDMLHSAIDGAQQLLNSLPFTNKNPQVRSYTPHYVGPRETEVTFEVSGNFVWAHETGKAPTLKVGGTTYRAAVTTSTLAFTIPAADLPHGSGVTTTRMEMIVPYEKGKVVKTVHPGTFHLLVGTLPARPVTELTVVSTRDVVGTATSPRTQPPDGLGWRVQSWDTCKYQRDAHVIGADMGWWIEPSSIRVNYLRRGTESRGRATIHDVQVTSFQVLGETWPNCTWGISYDSGDITYEVTYTLTQPSHTEKNERVDLLAANPDFSWGDQLSAPVGGRWTVHARMWDGSVYEASSANTSSNGVLKIRDQGDDIEIMVTAPSEFRG